MAVRDGRGDVKQTTTGFRGPLMVQSLTSAKSKFLSLIQRELKAPYDRDAQVLGGRRFAPQVIAEEFLCALKLEARNGI